MEKFRALPPAARLPLCLYRSLFPVAFVLMLPGFIARMLRRGNYRHKFGQRFGVFSQRAKRRLTPGGWTWIHAVSVGEMMMGLKLARSLQTANPGLRVLISATTSTGFALAREHLRHATGLAAQMELIYYPLDLSVIVRRVLNVVRPAQLVLVDKELWPNMVAECYRRSIPISIVNARLSPKSERGFLKWRRWVGPFFGMLKHVCVQEPEDIARWASFGVRREALQCTGSLKFDYAVPGTSRELEFRALLQGIGVGEGTPVLLAGSTFPGEEAILCRVLIQLRARIPDLFLILVPRHVERTPEVESTVRDLGLRPVLRTALQATPLANFDSRPDVLLVNTTGELSDWYGVATVCFVGKSIRATGGQNPAEPVLAGRPVVFGPHMENFSALVRQFLAAGGAIQVPDEAGLTRAVEPLLINPKCGDVLVDNARTVLLVHQGATERTATVLTGHPARSPDKKIGLQNK